MNKVIELLGDKSCYYLDHTCKTIDKSLIHIPSPDTIDKIWLDSDRNIKVLNSLQSLLGHGRLANTGYVSILPPSWPKERSMRSGSPSPIRSSNRAGPRNGSPRPSSWASTHRCWFPADESTSRPTRNTSTPTRKP